jgi:Serine hydrolase (FSH1)
VQEQILPFYTLHDKHIMPPPNGSQPLKILMLHGYTQSGPLFRAKTRALEKSLQKAYPGSTLSYPTGPLRLKPSDVPGFDPSTVVENDDFESYGWWRRSNTADPPEYLGIENGLSEIAKTLTAEGPFDGVAGFSQGAALAAMISSLLEGQKREDAFYNYHSQSSLSIPFPQSLHNIQHPPMKFCILYSGFVAPGERYRAFYDPHISTPSCHFIGSLDSVVEESRCRALVDAFGGEPKAQLVFHPGGHFLPSSKQFLDVLVSFICRVLKLEGHNVIQRHEDPVEDMDMPF